MDNMEKATIAVIGALCVLLYFILSVLNKIGG